jgi:hypothetical protein
MSAPSAPTLSPYRKNASTASDAALSTSSQGPAGGPDSAFASGVQSADDKPLFFGFDVNDASRTSRTSGDTDHHHHLTLDYGHLGTSVNQTASRTSSPYGHADVRTNVYIAWLPRTFEEDDLVRLVTSYGAVASHRLVQDAGRTYAFVLYQSKEDAERALVGLNATRFNGRRLQARISNAHDGVRAGSASSAGGLTSSSRHTPVSPPENASGAVSAFAAPHPHSGPSSGAAPSVPSGQPVQVFSAVGPSPVAFQRTTNNLMFVNSHQHVPQQPANAAPRAGPPPPYTHQTAPLVPRPSSTPASQPPQLMPSTHAAVFPPQAPGGTFVMHTMPAPSPQQIVWINGQPFIMTNVTTGHQPPAAPQQYYMVSQPPTMSHHEHQSFQPMQSHQQYQQHQHQQQPQYQQPPQQQQPQQQQPQQQQPQQQQPQQQQPQQQQPQQQQQHAAPAFSLPADSPFYHWPVSTE